MVASRQTHAPDQGSTDHDSTAPEPLEDRAIASDGSLQGEKGFSVSVVEAESNQTANAWDQYSADYQRAAQLPTDVVSYGPGVGSENEYRLLGPLNGKRFLDLGCGAAQSAIAAAKQGAIAIGVDSSAEQLAHARSLIEQEEVRVELKHGDLAELAFQRADSVDVAFSAMAFQYMSDLNRVFRQVHRVLKPQGMLVFSIPHPAASLAEIPASDNQLSIEPRSVDISRSYFDRTEVKRSEGDLEFVECHRTTSEIFMGLVRSGYRVDVVLEPELDGNAVLPQVLIIRARKEA